MGVLSIGLSLGGAGSRGCEGAFFGGQPFGLGLVGDTPLAPNFDGLGHIVAMTIERRLTDAMPGDEIGNRRRCWLTGFHVRFTSGDCV